MSYLDKLRDPRWQKVRLCEFCHVLETETRPEAEESLIEASRVPDVDAGTIAGLAHDLVGMVLTHQPEVVFSAIHHVMVTPEFQAAVIELYRAMLKTRREDAESEADHA